MQVLSDLSSFVENEKLKMESMSDIVELAAAGFKVGMPSIAVREGGWSRVEPAATGFKVGMPSLESTL